MKNTKPLFLKCENSNVNSLKMAVATEYGLSMVASFEDKMSQENPILSDMADWEPPSHTVEVKNYSVVSFNQWPTCSYFCSSMFLTLLISQRWHGFSLSSLQMYNILLGKYLKGKYHSSWLVWEFSAESQTFLHFIPEQNQLHNALVKLKRFQPELSLFL